MDDYLVQPMRDFVKLFEELHIPYAIMGGIAVGVHVFQGQLDQDYLRTWAAELGVEEKLRDAISQFHNETSGDQS